MWKIPYASLKSAVEKKERRHGEESYRRRSPRWRARPRPRQLPETKAKAHAVDYAKDVLTYTEYALGATAVQPGMDPAKVVELIDQLEAENPKSKYLDRNAATAAYVNAWLDKPRQRRHGQGSGQGAPRMPTNW